MPGSTIYNNNSNRGTSFDYAPPPTVVICINHFHFYCKYENKFLNKKTYFVHT